MIRLRFGFFASGIITGLIVLVSFLTSFSDSTLTMVFCDVGQGDSMYVRFPDGRDMLVDTGPTKKVLSCLSRHMPFWDRTIDVVVATHPEADHIGGLSEILSRFEIGYLVRSDIRSESETAKKVEEMVQKHHIEQKLVTAGDRVQIGDVTLLIQWPTKDQVMKMKKGASIASTPSGPSILGASTGNLNEGSVVMLLSYGTFDALLMADADSGVNGKFITSVTPNDGLVDVVKIPHHGARLALSDSVIPILFHGNPIAIISVGKNSYGHPNPELLKKLTQAGAQIFRTDEEGDIVISSDGKWVSVQ